MTRQQLEDQVTAQAARIKELEAQVAAGSQNSSKSRQQANQALELLKSKGTVSTAELAAINAKYPSDPIYFARTLLGINNIKTNRKRGQATTYTLVDASVPAVEAPVQEAVTEAVAEPVAA